MKIQAIILTAIMFSLTACSTVQIKLPPEPPRYIITQPEPYKVSKNSLWNNNSNIFVDDKAQGLNDLVTIMIVESASASKKAGTKSGRDSSLTAGFGSLFGLLDADDPLITGIKGSASNSFTGSGETTRQGALTASITAKVVEVLPNGNFIVESRKEITVNNEKQILVLQGQIRPQDIGSRNSILSTYVADSRIFYTGSGVVSDKQGQGWLVRAVDKVWPF